MVVMSCHMYINVGNCYTHDNYRPGTYCLSLCQQRDLTLPGNVVMLTGDSVQGLVSMWDRLLDVVVIVVVMVVVVVTVILNVILI